MQVCRPLYEGAYTYRHGGLSDLSPLQMFFPPAMWKAEKVARFIWIINP